MNAEFNIDVMKDDALMLTDLMQRSADKAVFLRIQWQTQLRNMHLAYIHAITQSGFKMTFYDNGAIKSVEPRGWSE